MSKEALLYEWSVNVKDRSLAAFMGLADDDPFEPEEFERLVRFTNELPLTKNDVIERGKKPDEIWIILSNSDVYAAWLKAAEQKGQAGAYNGNGRACFLLTGILSSGTLFVAHPV